jgi:hypothetical protein
VNTATAKGRPDPMRLGTLHAIGRFAVLMARARLSRTEAPTPFFTHDARPVVEPRIVSREERERAMAAL